MSRYGRTSGELLECHLRGSRGAWEREREREREEGAQRCTARCTALTARVWGPSASQAWLMSIGARNKDNGDSVLFFDIVRFCWVEPILSPFFYATN